MDNEVLEIRRLGEELSKNAAILNRLAALNVRAGGGDTGDLDQIERERQWAAEARQTPIGGGSIGPP